MERVPQFRCNKYVFATDYPLLDGLCDPLAYLYFVLIAECGINVSISNLECMIDSGLDLTGRGLPCPCSVLSATWVMSVKRIKTARPNPRAGISAPVFNLNRVSVIAVMVDGEE